MKTLLFSREDVQKIVSHIGLDQLIDDTIEGITLACREFCPTRYQIPIRSGFEYKQPHFGLFEWMPTLKSGERVMAKLVGYHPRNPTSQKLPTILSTVLMFDTESGHLISLVDGTFLTAVRTGAASTVATRILATPGSKVLGLIGCGAQAVTQLHALSRAFDLEQVLIFDVDVDTCKSFSERTTIFGLRDLPIQITPVEQLVSAADILCTATSIEAGKGPVFPDSCLKRSLHVNAVGSDFPGKVEVPHSLLVRSLVCPDNLDQAMKEGECQQLSSHEIGPDLVQLVQHPEQYMSYRETSTLFDSTGWALEDYVIVDLLVRYGKEIGCGTQVELECVSDDPKNPYGFVQSSADPTDVDPKEDRIPAYRPRGQPTFN